MPNKFLMALGLEKMPQTAASRRPGASLTENELLSLRNRMIAEQIASPRRGVQDLRVLAAMAKVPRHLFVPVEMQGHAYDDSALAVGYGQTISQPYIVAFMTDILNLKHSDRVLEIGTGSGYQTAVLAEVALAVYTIEIVEELYFTAGKQLNALGYHNVFSRLGDGYQGWQEAAPFDAIVVTCAPLKVPDPLLSQLVEGGRMILPIGGRSDQQLVLFQKKGNQLERRAVLPVRFVPMTGEAARV